MQKCDLKNVYAWPVEAVAHAGYIREGLNSFAFLNKCKIPSTHRPVSGGSW